MPKLAPLAVVIAELSVFIHTKAKKLYSLIDEGKDKQDLNYSAIDADHRNTYTLHNLHPTIPASRRQHLLAGYTETEIEQQMA